MKSDAEIIKIYRDALLLIAKSAACNCIKCVESSSFAREALNQKMESETQKLCAKCGNYHYPKDMLDNINVCKRCYLLGLKPEIKDEGIGTDCLAAKIAKRFYEEWFEWALKDIPFSKLEIVPKHSKDDAACEQMEKIINSLTWSSIQKATDIEFAVNTSLRDHIRQFYAHKEPEGDKL